MGDNHLLDVHRTSRNSASMPAPTDPYHLFVLIKDVRAILK